MATTAPPNTQTLNIYVNGSAHAVDSFLGMGRGVEGAQEAQLGLVEFQ